MAWLIKDFELLSVVLRALVLALEALTLGGLFFLLWVAGPAQAGSAIIRDLRRFTARIALAYALAEGAAIGLGATILVSSELPLEQAATASFFFAGLIGISSALSLALLLRSDRSPSPMVGLLPAAGILTSALAMSHAASQFEDRPLLLTLTAMHHVGMAGWVGAMAFLLLGLRHPGLVATTSAEDLQLAVSYRMARRYSSLAMLSVALLVVGGAGLAYFYVHRWSAVTGSSYGVMVAAKTWLALTMLFLGATNQRLLADPGRHAAPLMLRLRRFAEAEIGLGFTAVLAAASLTSQAPSMDLAPHDLVSPHEVVERLRWVAPRLTSPPLTALAPVSTIQVSLAVHQFGGGTANDANDRAWSEYNHHWAGIVVLAAALLALLNRALAASGRLPGLRTLARGWPLLFLGLAIFILLRADPENWPLGPRPFWASFSSPDVLEHRLYALLITLFALFEWAVETGRMRSPYAAWFFPLVCAAGGGALLTHTHGLGNVHDELLAELSHTPIAIFGAIAGWSRWIELRLPGSRPARIASIVWPLCLAMVAVVLLDYREA